MFRIGEFSKIAHVSGRLLRYYDEIGLLTPNYTDAQSGYRYYTAEQLPRLNRILALKDLGFSLDQIANLLRDDVSPEEIRGMLTMKKAQIEQTLREEVERLQHVEMRLGQIEHEGEVWAKDIVLKRMPTSPFLSLRMQGPTSEIFSGMIKNLQNALPSGKRPAKLGHFIVVLHSDIYDEEESDVEFGFLLPNTEFDPIPLSKEHSLTVNELAGVTTMASIVAQNWEEGPRAYNALADWVGNKGLQMAGPTREVFFSLQPPEKMANSMFEIQFPVTTK